MVNKLNVLFLPKYSAKGASSRYRFYNYEKWFQKEGIIVTYKPLFGDDYIKYLYAGKSSRKNIIGILSMLQRVGFLLFCVKKFEHVVIEAELLPKLPLKIEMFFLKRIKSFSLDYDDNISANYAGSSLSNKISSLIKKAQFVTVGNHWYMSEFEGNLIYLPTVIDIEKYPDYSNKKQAIKTVVWIGSPSTVKYLKLIEEELIELSEKTDFTLKIIGAKINLDPKIKVQFVEWNAETENKELAESTVGIMPLEDTYWEKGKCGFKLIQYMASGIPVVASDLPANREIITNGTNGFIASNKLEWKKFLEEILTNETLQEAMGSAARKRIQNHYTYQRWGSEYAKIIKENR